MCHILAGIVATKENDRDKGHFGDQHLLLKGAYPHTVRSCAPVTAEPTNQLKVLG